jgi:hypothetical protein
MNMAFGGYTWVGTSEQIADLSITHPYVDYNRLIERVLAVDAYRDAYRGHVRRLVEGPFDPARLRRRLAELKPVIEKAGEAARRAGKAGSPATMPSTTARLTPPDLTVFVTRRSQSMRDQLAGTSRGYLPAFRDPELVLPEWAKVVRPATALLAAMDADADGRLSETEVREAAGRLLGAGGARPDGSLDFSAATAAFDRSSTADMRQCATPAAWAKWLIHLADANHDGRVGAEEIVGAYRRLLAGSEKDFDGLMGGRELVEALSGAGVP